MTDGFAVIIQLVVAVLLMLSIGYCMRLNRRLRLLRADEGALRATIAELLAATETAERAIGGLKLTARECDAGLGERLLRAERLCAELDHRLAAGNDAPANPPQPATAPQSRADDASPPHHGAQAIAVAAQACAERLRSRSFGLAA